MPEARVQIRQGDVLLVPVADPRPGSVTRATDGQGQPLAGVRVEGERTGHAHELAGRVYDHADGRRLLMLERPGTLTHQEHAHVEVPAGWWEIRQQREHVPEAAPGQRTGRRWD